MYAFEIVWYDGSLKKMCTFVTVTTTDVSVALPSVSSCAFQFPVFSMNVLSVLICEAGTAAVLGQSLGMLLVFKCLRNCTSVKVKFLGRCVVDKK
jgi:hypothetical protein